MMTSAESVTSTPGACCQCTAPMLNSENPALLKAITAWNAAILSPSPQPSSGTVWHASTTKPIASMVRVNLTMW
ncbi:hypothetical protein D3C72_985930 [compost metagenome]